MKKILSYILLGGVIAFSSCEKKEVNYTPKDFAPAPAISAAVAAIEDSTAYVDFTSAGSGQLYYALTIGEDETVTPEAIIEGKVGDAVISESMDITSDGATVTLLELVQDTDYFMYSVSASKDGTYQKEITVVPVSTTDNYAPEFDGANSAPSFQSGGIDVNIKEIILQYDEPIFYDGTSPITILTYSGGVDGSFEISPENISTNGSMVVINIESILPLPYLHFIIIQTLEGSFKDATGNVAAEITGFSHYFKTRGESGNEIMQDFIGMNNFQNSDPLGFNSEGQVDVQLLEDTEDVVKLNNFLYEAGVPDVLEFKFDFATGSLIFEKTVADLHYNADPDNPDDNGLYLGAPTESFHYPVYYMPLNPVTGVSGQFDREAHQFIASYTLDFALGSYGQIDQMYEQVNDLTQIDNSLNKKGLSNITISNKIDDSNLSLTFY